jgi:uncharacterized protein (UPF0335 family)
MLDGQSITINADDVGAVISSLSLGTTAAEHLKAFVERIERLEEEKAAISNDIKEVYAEAKGNGFNEKIIKMLVKLRKMAEHERMEQAHTLETYMQAIGMDKQQALPL